MCINCNLLTPITDEFADYIGVERRKYLTFDSLTYKITNYKVKGTSYTLYNFYTLDFFRIDMDSLKELVVNFKSNKKDKNKDNDEHEDEQSIVLYEGKIKMIRPLPINDEGLNYIKKRTRDELYLECFDFSDVQEMFIEDAVVPPPVDSSNDFSPIANKYGI
jgi:hypothetical protein